MVKGDGDDFTKEFDNNMRNMIADRFAEKIADVNSDVLKFDDSEANESYISEKIHTTKYTFKNPKILKKFIDSVKHAGGGAKGLAGPDMKIKGNTVSIGVADKETLEILSMTAKELKGVVEGVGFMDVVKIEESQKIILSDGSLVIVDSETKKSLVGLHDSLNNDNQEVMREVIFQTEDAYNNIVELAKEHENDNI